jgi:hypothetical protein
VRRFGGQLALWPAHLDQHMEHKDREPEQLSVSIDMILAHIDQELTWASESTNSDGWSYQVVAATIAAIAVFVF